MVIKFFVLWSILMAVAGCTPCENDPIGENLVLEVPMVTYPNSDSILLGDTIWLEVRIDKEVLIHGTDQIIRLDSFNFFTELFISEISGSQENYFKPVDTIVQEGQLGYLPLATALAYPIKYVEHDDYYGFKAGLVMQERGLYWIGLSTLYTLFETYEHPALYICKNNRRDSVRIRYKNESTSLSNFENIFSRTQVAHLLEIVEFEPYAGVGSLSVVIF